MPVFAFIGRQDDPMLAVERIGKRLARATPEEIAQVIEGLNEILGT